MTTPTATTAKEFQPSGNKTWRTFLNWEATSQDLLIVKHCYLDIARDINAGILLSEIIYWHLPDRTGLRNKLRIHKDGYDWIARSNEEWFERTRLSRDKIERAIRKLEIAELIVIEVYKFNGNPTRHIRINEAKFLDCFKQVIDPAFNAHDHWKGGNGQGVSTRFIGSAVKPQKEIADPENEIPICEKLANGSAVKPHFLLRFNRSSITETTTQTTTETIFSGDADASAGSSEPEELSIGESTTLDSKIETDNTNVAPPSTALVVLEPALPVIRLPKTKHKSNTGLDTSNKLNGSNTPQALSEEFDPYQVYVDENDRKYRLVERKGARGKTLRHQKFLTKIELTDFKAGTLVETLKFHEIADQMGATHDIMMAFAAEFIGTDGELSSVYAGREAKGAYEVRKLIGAKVIDFSDLEHIICFIRDHKPGMTISLTSVASIAASYMQRKKTHGYVERPYATTQEKSQQRLENRDYQKIQEGAEYYREKFRQASTPE